MAYSNPRFGILNAGLVPTVIDASATLDNPERLVDGTRAFPSAFATADTDDWIRFDRLSAGLEQVNACYLGRADLGGATRFDLESSTDAAFTSPTALGNVAPAAGASALVEFSATTDRWLRVVVVGTASTPPEVGEIVWTNLRTTIRGPAPGWTDEPLASDLTFEVDADDDVLGVVQGPRSTRVELEYRKVGLSAAADLTLLDDLVANGRAPFIFVPAYSVTSRLMRLTDWRKRLDVPVPSVVATPHWRFDLRLRGS